MPKEIKDINDLVIELTMELCQKSPAAEKALSASTLVGGNDFSAIRILFKAGGSFPVASKLANCRLISGGFWWMIGRKALRFRTPPKWDIKSYTIPRAWERVSEHASKRESAQAKRAVRSKRTSERCERMSERTSEWPSTNVPISRDSESLWALNKLR